ncbi:UBX domain-containing protein 1 [Trypanosoma conorhini]|uniref:UBX domain-containing protein 1 n=1 Tax=Trypanosoma conorhini TaxID=83891 RepID=A0A3R7L1T3_9TRYP|nr:UBX domain-containing protein 1 [Trypanosoma conorhini]RNF19367.1 UBX domain-containing protein 1 [Trypanosoma conorhini]
MSRKEDDEVEALTAFMPWLKREEALELLKNYGGDAESVMRVLEETAASHWASVEGQRTGADDAAGKKVEKHFVGGGPSSGQVVLGGDGAVENVIESLFNKVRQGKGDEEVEEAQFFFGRGRRLGHTASASPFIEPTLRQRRDIVVTVYRDCYRVDDGPRMQKASSEGMAFFQALEAGVVPESIAAIYPNTNISVRLVDCTQHDAPSSFSAFAGEGRRLDAKEATAVAAPPSVAQTGGCATPVAMSDSFELHEDEETTKLAIVNLLGERKEFRVNPQRHTVRDVFFLAARHAQPDALSFQLIARDVPPRPLADGSLTIDAAKLRNATVMMRRL